ncbi:hypothetical protein BaRGS_00018252, partial [Batillaria attramentaria]
GDIISMGNNSSSEQPGVTPDLNDDTALSANLQAKIRIMGALSYDCRTRQEERAHLRERLADLEAERRRISLDLRKDGTKTSQSRAAALSASGVTRDTDKPALALSNLSSLLTEEEIEQLIKDFDEFDKNKDNLVSWEEYCNTRGRGGQPWGRDRRMSDLDELASWMEFKMADQNSDNCLDWWEFLNLAAQRLLGKRTELELVDLLTEKEVIRAKSLFTSLDQDHDGVVTGVEASRAVRRWCSKLQAGRTPEEVAKMSSQIDRHVEVRAQMFVGGDNQHVE